MKGAGRGEGSRDSFPNATEPAWSSEGGDRGSARNMKSRESWAAGAAVLERETRTEPAPRRPRRPPDHLSRLWVAVPRIISQIEKLLVLAQGRYRSGSWAGGIWRSGSGPSTCRFGW